MPAALPAWRGSPPSPPLCWSPGAAWMPLSACPTHQIRDGAGGLPLADPRPPPPVPPQQLFLAWRRGRRVLPVEAVARINEVRRLVLRQRPPHLEPEAFE